jgi:hypothetical protein
MQQVHAQQQQQVQMQVNAITVVTSETCRMYCGRRLKDFNIKTFYKRRAL